MKIEEDRWLKPKGYLHITPQINLRENRAIIITKITNPNFVKKYNFFPLIHTNLKDRKFKKIPDKNYRAHSYVDVHGFAKSNAKIRPLHYSTHIDALIFGYYNQILIAQYEKLLKQNNKLSEAIIAYRRIPLPDESNCNKSTIHFANESFEAIKEYASRNEEVCVMAFDIKKFFPSLNHELLKKQWGNIFGWSKLPEDHYKVFKAATRFSYILKDDLRVSGKKYLDEKKLAKIRKQGMFAFFESAKDFRENIKNGNIKIYTKPFMKDKIPCGIPQGLPISATLANLYLIDFDKKIIQDVVERLGGYYRRYSDDILIICTKDCINEVEKLIYTELEKNKVVPSKEKTEVFLFKQEIVGKQERLTSFKFGSLPLKIKPLIYLGFEFYGYQKLIKSTNLSKFYRRMISAVKSKTKIAYKRAQNNPLQPLVLYRRQLYKLLELGI